MTITKAQSTSRNFLFPVGEIAQIEINKKKYSVGLIGYIYHRYLFVDAPTSDGTHLVMPRGTDTRVRFITDGNVYGFESQIVKGFTKPVHMWSLSYPDEIESIPVRSSQRIDTFLPTSLETGNGETIDGAIRNLSSSGCGFSTHQAGLAEGVDVLLHLSLPEHEEQITITAQIKRIQVEGGCLEAGLAFSGSTLLTDYYSYCSRFLL